MRFRQMATYRGVPYEVGVGPAESDVVLFAACPPPEELGFEPAPGHWRKRVIRAEVDVLWESRPIGTFHGEACLVLDDLGDRLHIVYLGKDARRARELGYWQVDRGVFELLTPRDEVTSLTEEKVEKSLPRARAGARRASRSRPIPTARSPGRPRRCRPGPGRCPRPGLPGRAGPGPGGCLDRERRATAVDRHRRAPRAGWLWAARRAGRLDRPRHRPAASLERVRPGHRPAAPRERVRPGHRPAAPGQRVRPGHRPAAPRERLRPGHRAAAPGQRLRPGHRPAAPRERVRPARQLDRERCPRWRRQLERHRHWRAPGAELDRRPGAARRPGMATALSRLRAGPGMARRRPVAGPARAPARSPRSTATARPPTGPGTAPRPAGTAPPPPG